MTKFTKEDIVTSATENDVRYLRLMFTDILGTIKNVEVPISQLDKVLDNKLMFDGSSIEGFVRIEESDMYLYPDLDTWLIFPWMSDENGKIARLICDIRTPEGVPFVGDPRSNLRLVLDEMREHGFTDFNLGPEPEFFLFKLDDKGFPTEHLNDHGGYFDLAPTDLGENCRRDITLELEKIGFNIEASHHEVAPGQHEIDWQYADALKACDQIQTFKLVVRTIARKHGLHATFMAKPRYGISGSGMHCNVSLFDRDDNKFYDESDELGLSETCRHFIAGVLDHAPAMTAICNPTINSYKRLVSGFEAPVYIAWSPKNRSSLIRIPASRGKSTRIEVRSVDPTANPYLALAAILKAGLDGIKRKLEEPTPIDRNIYAMTQAERANAGIHDLPTDLREALEELERDDVMQAALGRHIYGNFVETKQVEWSAYRSQVTKWEHDTYFNF